MDTAKAKLAEIQAAHPHTADRVQLVEGDITARGLGLSDSVPVDDVNEVWHLAAVYDLRYLRTSRSWSTSSVPTTSCSSAGSGRTSVDCST